MGDNIVIKIFAIVGVLSGLFACFLGLCPCFFIFAGILSLSTGTATWGEDDATAFTVFGSILICCLLYGFIVGGLSLYVLWKKEKNELDEIEVV